MSATCGTVDWWNLGGVLFRHQQLALTDDDEVSVYPIRACPSDITCDEAVCYRF